MSSTSLNQTSGSSNQNWQASSSCDICMESYENHQPLHQPKIIHVNHQVIHEACVNCVNQLLKQFSSEEKKQLQCPWCRIMVPQAEMELFSNFCKDFFKLEAISRHAPLDMFNNAYVPSLIWHSMRQNYLKKSEEITVDRSKLLKHHQLRTSNSVKEISEFLLEW